MSSLSNVGIQGIMSSFSAPVVDLWLSTLESIPQLLTSHARFLLPRFSLASIATGDARAIDHLFLLLLPVRLVL